MGNNTEDLRFNGKPGSDLQDADEAEISPDHPVLAGTVPNIKSTCYVEDYQGAAAIFGHVDHSSQQLVPNRENEWWPCKSRAEFQLLSIIHRMDSAESRVTELLKSEFVSVNSNTGV